MTAPSDRPPFPSQVQDEFVKFNVLLLDVRPPRADIFGYSPDWFRVATGEIQFRGFVRRGSVKLSTGQEMVILREPR